MPLLRIAAVLISVMYGWTAYIFNTAVKKQAKTEKK